MNTTVTITSLIKWMKTNRYKHYHLAQTLRLKPAAVSQWKLRDNIPEKYHTDIKLIMDGKKKLTLKPLER